MIDKELFKLIGSNKKYIVIVVLLMILGLLFNISITSLICVSLFVAFKSLDPINYLYIGLGFLVAVSGRFLTTFITNKLKDKLGREVKKEIREKAYRKILTLGTRSQGDIKIAGLTQVCLEGIEQLDLYYSTYLPQFFYSMIAPILLFILSSFISWKVSIVLLCCVPLIPLSIIAVSKYAKKVFAKYWGKYISMGDSFLDCIQGLKELKVYNADARYQEKMNAKSEDFRKITMKVLVMQLASTTIMDLVAFGGAGVGIAITIVEAVNQTLNPFFALFLILIAVEFFLPLRALGSAFHVAMNGVSAGKKIASFLESKEPKWGNEKLNDGNIKLKNVYFKYEDCDKYALKDISMDFKPKEFTAIVGLSGSGKSTIVSLISRQNRITKGEILIGQKNIVNYSRESFYSKIAFISSNTYIFNVSIRENFKLADENVSDEEIVNALKEMKLDNLLNLKEGINTIINEDSTNISGGERQRLALAINLTKEKEIYIFDEATSNIDVESEEIIMSTISKIASNHTVILISHRLANVVKADNIYYLENGSILESGNHQELMDQEGAYFTLYSRQKELEEGYKNTTEVLNYAK